MKKIIFGDITTAHTHENNIIVHGCNAHGVMGSGVAMAIRNKWPGAFDEYSAYVKMKGAGNPELLGKVIPYADSDNHIIIANAITQLDFGKDGKKYVSYQAIDMVFKTIAEIASNFNGSLGIHYPQIGAGFGGGDWTIISDIIETVFAKYPYLDHYLWIME
jgi:O-acetyl-ADP-ribose deacetylase (regulator of RNase III)